MTRAVRHFARCAGCGAWDYCAPETRRCELCDRYGATAPERTAAARRSEALRAAQLKAKP